GDADGADRRARLFGLDDELVGVAAGHLGGAVDRDGGGVVDRLQRLLGEVLRSGGGPLLLGLADGLVDGAVVDLVGLAVVAPDVLAVVDEAVLGGVLEQGQLLPLRAVGG